MNIIVFDTETTSLQKPFCYNVGYIIYNVITDTILDKKEFVIEQVWHNLPLFESAYYANKRQFYVSQMRTRKIKMMKYGHVCRAIAKDIEKYNISVAYAYNSSFDEKVFNFNCDWFKCINPFDTVEIKDIRGFAHNFIIDNNYKRFCEKHGLFTDSGNYSTTAESVYKYIINNKDFVENHTALSDSEIELDILLYTVNKGANLLEDYQTKRSIERKVKKELIIETQNKKIFAFDCYGYTVYKSKNLIKLK